MKQRLLAALMCTSMVASGFAGGAGSVKIPSKEQVQESGKDFFVRLAVSLVGGAVGSGVAGLASRKFFKDNKIASKIFDIVGGVAGAFVAYKFILPQIEKLRKAG